MVIASTNNKSLMKIVGLILAMFALAGCQKDKASVTMSSSFMGVRGASGVQNQAAMSLSTPGVVYSDVTNQNAFQQAVAGLLSTDTPEESVGFVSCRAENNTGVFIGGRVGVNGGVLNSTSWGSVGVDPNSLLLITVYHSNAGAAGLPKLPFNRATGYISGQSAIIEFSDAYGSIKMQGTFNAQRFQGTISFDNGIRYDGARPGAAGTLGYFDIGTCEFFRCN